MESLDKATYDDCVLAYYSELLESKTNGSPVSSDELFAVSEAAARMYLKETATPDEISAQSTRLAHPFGSLCMSGLLDMSPYMEWAHARELPFAKAQVEKELARRRGAAASSGASSPTFEAGGNTYVTAGHSVMVVDAAFLRKK